MHGEASLAVCPSLSCCLSQYTLPLIPLIFPGPSSLLLLYPSLQDWLSSNADWLKPYAVFCYTCRTSPCS